VHYLGSLSDPKKQEILGQLALDGSASPASRAAALTHWTIPAGSVKEVVGIVADAEKPEALREAAAQALTGCAISTEEKVALEGIGMTELKPGIARVLGKPHVGSSRPSSDSAADWRRFLDSLPGDVSPARGQNVFHSPKLGGCAVCHRADGVGSSAGPDLTRVGKNPTAHYALLSLLQPNANVAPQYESYTVVTKDGQSRLAFQLAERGGDHSYVDLGGNVFTVKIEDLVSRTPLPSSIMPPGLVGKLTDVEVRDLIGYLESLSKGEE
jgi:putative heme-binding domain-containing protein